VIILEDVCDRSEKCEFQTIMDPYTEDRAKSVLTQFSKLHACFWRCPPPGVWAYSPVTGLSVGRTPPMLRIIGEHALKTVLARYGHLVTFHADVIEAYSLLLANFAEVRRFWSRGPLTLVHGDSHVANMFFEKSSGRTGFVDMQCVAAEHCMRDVAYHLVNSCTEDLLPQWEEPLIRYYLAQLHVHLTLYKDRIGDASSKEKLSYDDAYFLYRTHAMHTVIAWVICCGTSELVQEPAAVFALKRVFEACHRLKSLDALKTVLK
jgi:hypothetical protein